MKELKRFGILFSFLLTLLCSGATVAGRAQPVPDLAPGLSLCDGKLCVLGLTLGDTAMDTANALLTQTYGGLVNKSWTSISYDNVILRFVSIDSKHLEGVQEDYLSAPRPVSVGQWLARYGIPCAIEPEPLQLYYAGFDIMVADRGANLDVEAPIKLVFIHKADKDCMISGTRQPWRGFTHYSLSQQ
ncbi:MAG TPA: hypothetical protein VMT34_10285 [Aggregatilineales bacterium]|nr:hypothetical protein [Aggregatilineales bacterium]